MPTINVSANNNEAFIWACKNGHLHVAQWLYQITPSIDVSANNNEAFIYMLVKTIILMLLSGCIK